MRYLVLALALSGAPALLADTEDSVRRSVPIEGSSHFVLSAEFGAIRIQPGATGFAEVEIRFRGKPHSRAEFDRMLRDFALDVTPEGSRTRVEGRFKNGWRPASSLLSGRNWCHDDRCLEYTWLRHIEYRVSLPRQMSVDLSTSGGSIQVGDLTGAVAARTSGGSLSFGRIDGAVNGSTSGGSITLAASKGKAVLHTSGGTIRIEESAGEVDAETSGGSIHVNRAGGRVRARTSGGGISIRDCTGAIDASTSGGNVTASLLAQPAEESRLSTSGGSIRVDLASNARVEVEASTSGGSVSTDFPVSSRSRDRSSLRAAINGGGPLLQLRTSGGGIQIRRAR